MITTQWNFSRIQRIEKLVIDETVQKFYKKGVYSIIRENLQNSLDAALSTEKPVKVKIKLGKIPKDKLPLIDDITKHVMSLKGGNEYTNDQIQTMVSAIKESEVDYISFEDEDTKGLLYSKDSDENTWDIYAYKKGVHNTCNSLHKESRGGSFGVGKLACNAASKLNLMYFINKDVNGLEQIGGTIQLIEHELDNVSYRDTGFFAKTSDGNELLPIDNCYDGIFRKETRGLKIVVPFCDEEFLNIKELIRNICDNFFVAILDNKLVVEIADTLINKDTITDIVFSKEIYDNVDPSDIKDNFTPLYIHTYTNSPTTIFEISDKNGELYKFNLYFQYNKQIAKGRTAIIRSIGMKIEDKKIDGKVKSHYNAILIPANLACDKFLKSLENESHDELSASSITDNTKQRNAKKFLSNLQSNMKDLISEFEEKEIISNEVLDVADILFTEDLKFKKKLEKNIQTLDINLGKNKPKSIVKIKDNKRKNNKKDDKTNIKTKNKNINRKLTKTNNDANKQNRVRYHVRPEWIKRISLQNKEILSISIDNLDNYNNQDNCQLILNIIDGEYHEYKDNDVALDKIYTTVIDGNNNNKCELIDNCIKNVSIEDGRINLELENYNNRRSNYNFVYMVEV